MLGLLFLIPGFAYSSAVTFTISPKKSGPVIVYSGQPMTVVYKVVNTSPTVLTGNFVRDLPAGVTQALVGGGCGRTFNLARGGFCWLSLTINADKVKSIPKGVPKVCSAKSIYCSIPAGVNQLSIVKRPAQTVLTASPASFSFLTGGTKQIVTITNKGKVNATGIVAKLAASPALGVMVANKCPTSLSYVAPKNTCQLIFTPGKTAGSTSAIISSNNSPSITAQIKVAEPQKTATVTLTPEELKFNIGSGTGNSLTIKNSSNVSVENIKAEVPKGFAKPTYSDKCEVLGNGQQCVISFTATDVVENGYIYITGKNMKSYTIRVEALPAEQASLSVNRAKINLSPGGNDEAVELSNTSKTVDANNLHWTLPDGVTLVHAGSPCDGHSLPKGQSCKLQFKAEANAPLTENDVESTEPSSKSSGPTITIEADQTKPVQIGVTITQAILKMENEVSAQPYNLTVDKPILVGELHNKGNVNLIGLSFTPTDNWQLDTSDPANCTQDGTIPVKSFCYLVLNASQVTDGPADIEISSKDSNPLTISFNASNGKPIISIDQPSSTYLLDLDSLDNGIEITVKNTGSADTGLNVGLPDDWVNDSRLMINNDCQSLMAGRSCIIKVNSSDASAVHLPAMMTIEGKDTGEKLQIKLAMVKGGGLVFANQDGTVKVAYLTDIKPSERFPWKLDYDSAIDASSVDNGVANTSSIFNKLGVGDYAAGLCSSLNTSPPEEGDSGWYLPAICELGYNLDGSPISNCGGSGGNDMANLIGISRSGLFTPPSGAYWSSTEESPGTSAYIQKFYGSDIYQDKQDEYEPLNVRCIRSFSY